MSDVSVSTNKPQQYNIKQLINSQTAVKHDNKYQEDKEMSNSAKFAIGATALGVVVLAGLAIAGRRGVGPFKRVCEKTSLKPKADSNLHKLPSFSLSKDEFAAALKETEFVKPSSIPDDIPSVVDFSKGRILEVKDAEGVVIRKYISAPDKKTVRTIIDYNPITKKPKKILKYYEGKLKDICECGENGYEIKRTVYRHGTDKLKGIVTKGTDGKELTVKFKENGIDLDYVHNLSSDFGEVNTSIKF